MSYNVLGISEVPDRKGGNLVGAIAKSDMHLLYAPDRDEPCEARRRVAGDGHIA